MASPLTTSSSLDARKSAIDSQAVSAVAASPSFMTGLRLPPIPPSTPPLERRELEAHRNELAGQLVWAAARGNETEYRRIFLQLDPNATELTMASSYGSARMAFLEKRQDLLIKEITTGTNDQVGMAFWMRQLAHNTQERFNIDPQGMGTPVSMLEGVLRTTAARIPGKPGTAEYNRRLESMLDAAVDAGFPVREAFRIFESTGVANQPSVLDPNDTMTHRLLLKAITRSRELFAQCVNLYSHQDSPSAEVEFAKRYREFTTMMAGLLPRDFDQAVLGRPDGHSALLNDLQLHLQISANSVFVP